MLSGRERKRKQNELEVKILSEAKLEERKVESRRICDVEGRDSGSGINGRE